MFVRSCGFLRCRRFVCEINAAGLLLPDGQGSSPLCAARGHVRMRSLGPKPTAACTMRTVSLKGIKLFGIKGHDYLPNYLEDLAMS